MLQSQLLGQGFEPGGQLESLDPDAQAFIVAAGITVSSQIAAINTLVLSLKNTGTPPFWDSEVILYPFVGGTAASHAVNLINPGGANDLTYPVAPAHSDKGIIGNGTTYANTQFKPNAGALTAANARSYIYIYDPAIALADKYYWGSFAGSSSQWYLRRATAGAAGLAGNRQYEQSAFGEKTIAGFTGGGDELSQHANATSTDVAINGGAFTNFPGVTALALPSSQTFLLCLGNAGAPFKPIAATISGFAIGSRALTQPEWVAYHNIWQTFQTALGRQRP